VDLDLVFLGTAGSMPTAQRAPAALLVRRGGERLLFDCAEGTQRQLLKSSVGLVDLPEIFLTHFHADHVLGLPGMFKSFALRGRELPLEVYGPRGLRDLLGSLKRVVGKLTYDVSLNELEPGAVLERDGYRLATFGVRHGVNALGWSLIEVTRPGRFDVEGADALGVPNGPERGALQRGEPVTLPDGRTVTPDQVLGPARAGRKIVLTGDTAPSDEIVEAAWGADVLVTEATFSEEESERALETMHQTAAQAAEAAKRAGVRLLALTHLSNRYFGPEIAREAREIFPETVVPRDFDRIEVPFAERGVPQLVKGGALHPREAGARIIRAAMTSMVRVAVAGDITEAEEIQEILRSAGIEAEVADGEDDSVTVSVPESSVEQAQDAIEAMTEPEEIVGEP
jgi:ribonuclease Z